MTQVWHVTPVLGVRNVRQAAEYYRDVLGFTLEADGVFQPSPDEPGGVYGIVKRCGARLHFQIRRGEMPARQRGSYERDAYFYVDDVDALHEELQRRGARILAAPQMTPHGIRELVVEDLNGYLVAFGELPRSTNESCPTP